MSQFMTGVKEVAEFIIDILSTDRDAVAVITGETGEGKSVLLWNIAIWLMKLTGEPFDPVTNLVYDKQEFNNLIDKANERTLIGVDEAVGLFYARDYHDPEQIALLKKLDRIRYRHLVIAFLIPSLFHMDKHIRDARVRLWIHVDQRKGKGEDGYAHAYIFKKEKNPFESDPWNLNDNKRLFRRGKIDKSPNYMGEILFYDIPTDEYRLYETIKDAKRRKTEVKEWRRAGRKSRGEKVLPEAMA